MNAISFDKRNKKINTNQFQGLIKREAQDPIVKVKKMKNSVSIRGRQFDDKSPYAL